MEGNQESWRSEMPFAICQELLSCCYRVAVARSHIKQINLVRGSVCFRPSGFQKLPLPPPPSELGSLVRSLGCLTANPRRRLCPSFILIRRLNENEVAVIAVSRKRDSLNWRDGALYKSSWAAKWLAERDFTRGRVRVSCSLLSKSKLYLGSQLELDKTNR